MRVYRSVVLAAFCFLSLAVSLHAQQTVPSTSAAPSTSDPRATTLLQQALGALTGGQAVTDVTVTGAVRRIAGQDDETGTVVLKALATGESRIDMSFPSGNRSGVRTNSANGPVGTWKGPDGALHPVAAHNLLVNGPWFFPALMLSSLNSSSGMAVTDAGQETRDGRTVEHLTAISQQASNLSAYSTKLFQHLTQVDVYVDSSTLLPMEIVYNIHPPNDPGRDAPMETRYSDYRAVNGMQIPFHIQQFLSLNLILVFDLQIQSTAFNTGLSASSWNAQ